MKKYTKEEIDRNRSYFMSQKYDRVHTSIQGKKFSFFILPQESEPNLEHFVMRMTGEPEDGFVFGIADSVREDFRLYAVAHEYIEFMELGMDTPDRCVKALEQELELVPEKIKTEYIQMRRDFFSNLIDYCTDNPEYTADDLKEFRQCLERLEELS